MEIKINREVRDYTESLFFGLSLRQTIFSALAVVIAVGVYFGFRDSMGMETVSWVCMLCAAPFAALGFLKYNGMSAERFLLAWLRSELLTPRQLKYIPSNFYAELMKGDKEDSEID